MVEQLHGCVCQMGDRQRLIIRDPKLTKMVLVSGMDVTLDKFRVICPGAIHYIIAPKS